MTDFEFSKMKKHPAYTEQIVGRVKGLNHLAALAGAHHEKLDGRGYHRGIEAGKLPITARLLTGADIFEAVTAARPYREGMPIEKAREMLAADAGAVICGESVAALNAWLDRNEFTTRVSAQLEAIENLVDSL
jgi:HD-GYP domain-containing protein (c-di-GMP phosphodiesterase class II)